MKELLFILHAQGWIDVFLQGTSRKKMGREETRQYNINASGTPTLISSVVNGKALVLSVDVISTILRIPNFGWWHFVKRECQPLDGFPSALDVSRKFSNDRILATYCHIEKGAMQPLHKLLFHMVYKFILPRRVKRTEASYLDLTIMEYYS